MPYNNVEDYAELYDKACEMEEDIEFYIDQAKNVDGKVLEIGCGTGRIYLKLLEEEIDAYGIDLSEEMLDKLRAKARERDLDPEVSVADMRDFNLDESFSLIIIPYRSFLHNLSIEDQLSTLETIYHHLEDDGTLILNFYNPDLDVISKNYGRTRKRKVEDGEYTVVEYDEIVDPINWISEFEKKLVKDGEEKWSSRARTKLITKREFELLLMNSRFSDWSVYGGFKLDELEDSKQEMVWIVKK